MFFLVFGCFKMAKEKRPKFWFICLTFKEFWPGIKFIYRQFTFVMELITSHCSRGMSVLISVVTN